MPVAPNGRRSITRSHGTFLAMEAGELLDAPEYSLERIDARSAGENFPVASLLAPREARPHLRAVYGFARLVDNLGDEAAGDRLALLAALEGELAACYGGTPRTAIMRRLQHTIAACVSGQIG